MDATASDINTALDLASAHAWVPLSTIVIGLLVRVAKSDAAVRWFPIQIAPRWRAWAALVLGVTWGVLHKLGKGGTWGEAIVGGLVAGAGSTLGHELLIESLRQGRDLGMPKDDSPKPPPPPPVSIKPPAGPNLTLWLVVLALVLVGCPPRLPDPEAAALVVNAGACRQKGLALVADGGTCEEKRERLEALVRTDPDCIALFADAGPVLRCKSDDGGEWGSHGD